LFFSLGGKSANNPKHMKKTFLLSMISAATVVAASAADFDPAQLQGFPKNLARQHLGANLFQYNASTSAYSPTAASAAWLDDDISTGYAMLSGKQYYLLAFPQAELISNFELSAKPANGTISLYAGDEPAAPTAKSWSLLAKDIPFDAINEKRLGQTFARTAKYILIETNISDPGPVYSLYVYGNRPAVAYDIRNREQAIDTKNIFGPYTNDATAFNVASLYGKSFVRSQEGTLSPDLQKAIDDNPETFITLGGGQASAVELRSPEPQQISRVAVEVNPGAKGRLEFFLSNNDGAEATTPAATIMLDGSSTRANVDFPGANASVIRARWTAANGADAVKLHELNAFGSKSLAINTVTSGPDLIAERDGIDKARLARAGRDGKETVDAKDMKDAKALEGIGEGPAGGPYLPGALGFPPTPTLRNLPPPLPPEQPPLSP
jgi:hypothetical protein